MTVTTKHLAAVAAIVAVIALVFVGTARITTPNQAACTNYAAGYNRMADAALTTHDAITKPTDPFAIALQRLPADLTVAYKQASGPVAATMQVSPVLAKAMATNASDIDVGQAFFANSLTVTKACRSAGAPIQLHGLRTIS